MVRKYTNRILELVDEGVLDARDMLAAALSYMSEAEVEDLYHCEGLDEDEDEDEDEGEVRYGTA